MACATCATERRADGTPAGCGSKGSCLTGSCNRMSTFDWLTIEGVRDVSDDQHYVEVAFKHGAHKDFFYCPPELGVTTGDTVVVEAEGGTDAGHVTLSGELVLRQMARKRTKPSHVRFDVVRRAHERDLARIREARDLERDTLVRARVIAYATELRIKLSDVEYQADLRKATFYYTSEARVDFRELVKSLAREFRVRVEMRQLGDRQEAGRLGGIGSCGRELCCSTWLSDFQSVTTAAARYQGLALNQTKLSGQCGRLKCCLNYELDTYLDALQDFPKKADKLRFPSGKAVLVKTDVFKGLLHYQVMEGRKRGPFVTLTAAQVKEVMADPDADIAQIVGYEKRRQEAQALAVADEHDYDDVTGAIDIPLEKRRRKKRGKKGGPGGGGQQQQRRSGGKGGSGSGQRGKSSRRGGGGAQAKSAGGEGGTSVGGGANRSRRRGGSGKPQGGAQGSPKEGGSRRRGRGRGGKRGGGSGGGKPSGGEG